MTEAKRKKVIYAIFVGAVIFGVVAKPWERRQPGSEEDASAPTAPVPATVVAADAVESGGAADGVSQMHFAAEWPENPFVKSAPSEFKPAAGKANKKTRGGNWMLQGVMTVKGQRVCVVNGRTHHTGGIIDGWRIAKIGKEEVLLTRGAEQIRMALR